MRYLTLCIFLLNCATAMKISPIENTEILLNNKLEKNNFYSIRNISIKKDNTPYRINFLNNGDLSYYFNKLNSYSEKNDNCKYFIDLEIKRIFVDDNSIKNFFIQVYGFWIGMPWWNGLSYEYNIRYNIKVYSIDNNDFCIFNKEYNDDFVLNYTSKSRSVSNAICGILWIPLLSAPSCILGVIPSNLEEKELDQSLKVFSEYFKTVVDHRTTIILKENISLKTGTADNEAVEFPYLQK
jgi:hypothetical protein